MPPRRLRARTGAPGVRQFLEGGRQAAGELQAALAAAGRSFAEFSSVLDLGCGSGRVLPHVSELATDADCVGCDVDATAIDWAAHHHPTLRWSLSRFEPPLPFPDGRFELVYSISVLSHLEETLQDKWLAEVARVLRPGGVALLSVHGAYAFEQFRTGNVTTAWCERPAFERESLAREEFAFVPYARSVWNQADLPGIGTGYGLAFHGKGYVYRHWSDWLRVDAILERAMTSWQDVVVCAK